MPEDNKIQKKCPFLGEPCIGEKCALCVKITQQQAIGIKSIVETCALVALVMVSANRPQQVLPLEKIQLPNLRK